MKNFILILLLVATYITAYSQSITADSPPTLTQTTASVTGSYTGTPQFVFNVEWSTDDFVTTPNSSSATYGSNLVSANITGLTPGTTYKFRFYSVFLFTETWSNAVTFTTPDIGQAKNITFSNITGTSMTLTWEPGDGNQRIVVAKDGTGTITAPTNGTDYNASSNFSTPASPNGSTAVGHNVLYDGSGTSVAISGLNAATTYTFQVFEYLSSSFTYQTTIDSINNPNSKATTGTPPTVLTYNINTALIDSTKATFNANITDSGSSLIVQRGFIYSKFLLLEKPELDLANVSKIVEGGTSEGEYSKLITSLTPNTKYVYRSFTYNQSDTAYGDTNVFITHVSVSSSIATSIDSTFATLGGIVANKGAQTVSERGVCYSLASDNINPEWNGVGVTSSANGTGFGAFSEVISSLNSKSQYYFKAYAINLQDTSYGTAKSFTTLAEQARDIVFSDITGDSITLTWTRGNGDECIVVAHESTPVSVNPQDTKTYTANNVFGSGSNLGSANYVVYRGTDNTFTIKGLKGLTTYHFKVFESCGVGTSTKYQIADGTSDNPSSKASKVKAAPENQAHSFVLVGRTKSTISISCSKGDGEKRIIVIRPTGTTRVNPTDSVTYTASTTYAGAGSTGTNNYVVLNGTGNSVTVGGLLESTSYTFVVYAYNNPSTHEAYNQIVTTANEFVISTAGVAIWNGLVSTDWSNPANWNTYEVPGFDRNVVIPTTTNQPIVASSGGVNNLAIGGSLTITGNTTLSIADSLILLSPNSDGPAGQLVIDNNSANCNVGGLSIMERYYHSDTNLLVSSPLADPIITNWSGFYVYKWLESSQSWDNTLTASSSLDPMEGLNVNFSAPKMIIFTGAFKNGNTSINVTRTNPSEDGWNLIGNPYPSAINWFAQNTDSIELTNVNSTAWIYNSPELSYTTCNSTICTGGGGSDGTIAPGQGFFVQCNNDNGGSVTFNNTIRTASSQSFQKNGIISNLPVIRFSAKNDKGTSEMVVMFDENATSEFDSKFDAQKKFGGNTNLAEVYTMLNTGIKLVINALNTNSLEDIASEGFSIPVGFNPGYNGEIEFSISSLKNIPNNIIIYLKDNSTGKYIDLRTNNFIFYIDKTSNDRFELIFTNLALSQKSKINLTPNILIYTNKNSVFVKSELFKINNANILIYDILGKTIFSKTNSINDANEIPINISGTYIVKVIVNELVVTQKVVVP